MKAAELYRTLAAQLGPSLRQHGFRKVSGSRLAFQRAVGRTHQTVWFHADKYGWDRQTGSRFFANFTVSDAPTFDTLARHTEGLFFFLTDAELARAREFRNSVVARIPRPPAAYFETLDAEFARLYPGGAEQMMAAIRAEFEPDPIPYRRQQDIGMRYWLATDVDWWATFIAAAVPRAIEQMNGWSAETTKARAGTTNGLV